MPDRLEKLCAEKGLRMTDQRRVIARVLSTAEDHPNAEELHKRAEAIDPRISLATVYRTVKLFEDAGIITRHEFNAPNEAGKSKARYEELTDEHHDHLIDVQTGAVLEFVDAEIERLQEEVARRMGYRLIDHRLELYAVPLKSGEE